ncbi:MAG TPA: YhjD/YihY/BrkB family envelope integrity protein [Smithellaceae bacterium]|nr:YhjD/YihY/BrkB family envelope integrity protein [Smithellaceae bacterium]
MGGWKKIKSIRSRLKTENLRMQAAGGWDIMDDAITNYRLNGDTNQAAAISLYAILSAIPLFILTIVAAGYVFSSYPQIHAAITEAVSKGFFSEKIIFQLGQIEKKRHLLGWAGVLALIWLSAMIFDSMATALNIIFRSRKSRNYFLAKLLAISMIPMAWIVGIASVAISYIAALLVKQPAMIAESFGFSLSLSAVSAFLLRYVVPYLITTVFFIVVYRVIPTTKIRLSVAVAGSAIFALLTEIVKQLFTWYAANYTRYDVIFGSLEAIVILVIGVFYIALIFLFCAELMSSYQRRDILLLERAMLKPRNDMMKVDERLFKKFGHAYPQGSTIFNEGDTGSEMYYVLSGRVLLEKDACQVKKQLADMGPGQYFGEMAALIDIPRSATARAATDSHLAVIGGSTLRDMLRESREIGVHMLREFARRLKNSNMALEGLTNLWTRMALVIYFMDNTGVRIPDHLPQLTQLAKREAAEVKQILAELAAEGILLIDGERLVGVAREKMWEMINSGDLKKCFLEDKDKV